MKFKNRILKPDYNREPYFDGYDIEKADKSFDCVNCKNTFEIKFDTILQSTYSWKEDFNENDKKDISDHFKLNVVGKSHDGGWPSIFVQKCPECHSSYLFYFGVREPHHSVHKVVQQGISQIKMEEEA